MAGLCRRRATLHADHASAALPPGRALIAAANSNNIGASTEAEMLGKVFALTAVIGLLVASSAAFVSNHSRGLVACAANCD
jgi:hypothetical protein